MSEQEPPSFGNQDKPTPTLGDFGVIRTVDGPIYILPRNLNLIIIEPLGGGLGSVVLYGDTPVMYMSPLKFDQTQILQNAKGEDIVRISISRTLRRLD